MGVALRCRSMNRVPSRGWQGLEYGSGPRSKSRFVVEMLAEGNRGRSAGQPVLALPDTEEAVLRDEVSLKSDLKGPKTLKNGR